MQLTADHWKPAAPSCWIALGTALLLGAPASPAWAADVVLVNQTRSCNLEDPVALSRNSLSTRQIIQAADDFTINVADTWTPTRLEVLGLFDGAGSSDGVDIEIYRNSRGLVSDEPGSLVCVYSALSAENPEDPNFVFDLRAARTTCNLSSQTYWLSVVYRAEGPSRSWYWAQNDTLAAGTPYHAREPTNAGAACADWQPAAQCFDHTTVADDLCFRLEAETRPRLIEPFDDRTAGLGTAFALAAAGHFEDTDGDALTFSAQGLPPSLTVDPASGLVSGVISDGDLAGAPYPIRLFATDDNGNSASGSFTLSLDDLAGTDFRFNRLWPVLQQPWYFGKDARAIHLAGGNRLFVANPDFKLVQQFSLDGLLISSFGVNRENLAGQEVPLAISSDADGNLYVAGGLEGRIYKLDPSGEPLLSFGGYPSAGGPYSDAPNALAVSATGCAFLPDRARTPTAGCVYVGAGGSIYQYNRRGELLTTFGTSDLTEVTALATFRSTLYAIDRASGKLIRYEDSSRGPTFVRDFDLESGIGGSSAADVAVSAQGLVYVTHSGRAFIDVYDGVSATPLDSIAGPSRGTSDLVFTGTGSGFYSILGAIQRFKLVGQRGGQSLSLGLRLESGGAAPGYFNAAGAMTTDEQNRVWTIDAGNGRVQVFSAEGVYEFEFPAPTVDGIRRFVFDLDNVQSVAGERIAILVDAAPADPVVQFFDSSGNLTGEISLPGVSGIRQLAGDGEGRFYVAGDLLYQFDLAGNLLTSWPSTTGTGFDSVDVGPDGLVYLTRIAGSGSSGIEIYEPAGSLISSFDRDLEEPIGAVPTAQGLILLGENNIAGRSIARITLLRGDGQELGSFGGSGFFPAQFDRLIRLDLADNGVLYATDGFNDRVQAFQVLESIDNTKVAMVMGGGPYPGNNLWDATRLNVNFAYVSLLYQGFRPEDIQLLSAQTNLDLDGNGLADDVDADATVANLQDTLLNWAADADNLILYLADHGASEVFRMSETELLDAATLGGWLDQLQGSIWNNPGRITTLYEACESGSFMDDLSSVAHDRVVITTAAEGQDANFVSQGFLSFSNQFWTRVFNGDDLKDAYESARDVVTTTYPDQEPALNVDGDALTDEPVDDLDAVAGFFFGSGNLNVGTGPVITSVSPPQNLDGGNTTALQALGVTDEDGVARVWAVVRPPAYQSGDADNPVLELPQVELLAASEGAVNYAADYSGFSVEGVYVVDIYAQDQLGNVSQPGTTTVTVGNPLPRKAIIVTAGEVNLPEWPAYNLNANLAYQALITQGYLDLSGGVEEIRYLSQGGTQGVDQGATLGNLQQALADAGNAQDVTVYLVGPRVRQGLLLNGAQEVLTAAQLGTWLDGLAAQIPGVITVLVDTDRAGEFLRELTPASGDRIVLASAAATGSAAFLQDGALSFSQFFWNRITNGESVRAAFQVASQAIAFAAGQLPQLDDNGNGRGNDPEDGQLAQTYFLGPGLVQAGNQPAIGIIDPDLVLEGSPVGTVGVNGVTATGQVNRVFGVVSGPLPAQPGGSFRLLPRSQKGASDADAYEGTYEEFGPTGGLYEVAVFAQDNRGIVSFQKVMTVEQRDGPDGYEVDDAPAQARTIFVDDVEAQPHNFHDDGDEDWMRFFAFSGVSYDIQATDITGGISLQLAVLDETGGSVLASASGSGGVTLSWTGDGNGARLIRVRAATATDRASYRLRIFRPTGLQVGQLEGTVTNALDGSPVAGALVSTDGAAAAFTDQSGLYRLVDAVGTYVTQVQASGFESISPGPGFELFESQTTYLNLGLTPEAGPPNAVTDAATELTQVTVQLNGRITPNGLATQTRFRWGTDPGPLDQTAPAEPSPVLADSAQTPVTAALSGLTCGSDYQFLLEGDNNAAGAAGGVVQGQTLSFSTATCTDPPLVGGEFVDQLAEASAQLNAQIDPRGSDTTAAFDYGLTANYGSSVAVPGILSGTGNQAVAALIAPLTCETPYHYRVRASNPGGETVGSDQTFATAACPQAPPLVTTLATPLVDITATTADIRANVDPQGASTSVAYQLKTASSATDAYQSAGADITAFATVSVNLTGLDCGRTYFYQFRASNSGGVDEGTELTLTTAACPAGFPDAQTGSPEAIAQTGGRLTATVNPAGSDTTVTFDYGPTDAYGDSIAVPGLLTGDQPQPVSSALSGLACGTSYHYRVRAANAAGTSFGANEMFRTQPCQQILLVDDDDNSPDVRATYTSALDDLGFGYQVWNTAGTDSEPTLQDLLGFDTVIWWTGDADGNATGPSAASETALINRLQAEQGTGVCVVISSQDYLTVRGSQGQPTPLMAQTLGVEDGQNNVTQTVVSGLAPEFSLLGPYTLDYAAPGLIAAADALTPAADATAAFSGSTGSAAVARRSAASNTLYLAFPLPAVPSAVEQAAIIDAALGFCRSVDRILANGFE